MIAAAPSAPLHPRSGPGRSSPRRRPSWGRRALLLGNLAAPLAVFASGFAPFWIGFAVVVHALLIYALVAPSCPWLGPVITQFRTAAREVWLTIDDGPAGAATGELAEALQARGVPATFFVKGQRLAQEPHQAAVLQAAGHTLANHTHTHPASNFWWLLPSQLRRELDACETALRQAGAGESRWFRAPVGLKHVWLHRELAARDWRLIGWNVRGRDGLNSDPEAVLRRVLRAVKPGAIVVLHEGRPRSREGILRVVDELQARGYRFVIPTDEQLF